jgi:enoyl-[acyl-carrier protein] reductase III
VNQTADTDVFSLRGRRALVVGGTRGIGRAIACRFAAAGADVLANYVRNDEAAREVVDFAAAAGWSLRVVRADVASDKGREALLAAVAEQFADLSVVVFAAASGVHRPCTETTGRHFDFTYGLNVRAFLLLTAGLAPRIAEDGSIIALSSEGAVHAMSNYGLVGSSKAALEALCRHLAVELAPRGIRVNVLSPGSVRTDAWLSLPDAERRLADAARQTPRGRLTTLDEVAHAAQFLGSRASSGVSGHTLVVDGGARVRGAG